MALIETPRKLQTDQCSIAHVLMMVAICGLSFRIGSNPSLFPSLRLVLGPAIFIGFGIHGFREVRRRGPIAGARIVLVLSGFFLLVGLVFLTIALLQIRQASFVGE